MIEEIPIDTVVEEKPELLDPVQSEEIVQAVAKKRGRPKGSLNKKKNAAPPPEEIEETPRPAAKRAASSAAEVKPKKKRRPPTPESSSEEEAPPRKKRRAARAEPEQEIAPAAPDTRQIAADVLYMLSAQNMDMRQAKRERYRSWFQ